MHQCMACVCRIVDSVLRRLLCQNDCILLTHVIKEQTIIRFHQPLAATSSAHYYYKAIMVNGWRTAMTNCSIYQTCIHEQTDIKQWTAVLH